MICQYCNKDAKFNLTYVDDDGRESVNLCAEHALGLSERLSDKYVSITTPKTESEIEAIKK